MNRRSFLARFIGGLAAISLRLEDLPKANEPEFHLDFKRRRIFYC